MNKLYMREIYEEYKNYSSKIFKKAFKDGHIKIYDNDLIIKLRDIYDGGIPASIILLSNAFSNGYCYDRALLLSRAFLDTEDDIKLIYAEVDSIKLNPDAYDPNKPYADHCFLQRTTPDGKTYIYDTSRGLIFDKETYMNLEHPVVRKINTKRALIDAVDYMISTYPTDFIANPMAAACIIPSIEETYNNPDELYTNNGDGLLEYEVEHFKKQINYDEVCSKMEKEIKELKLKIDEKMEEENK